MAALSGVPNVLLAGQPVGANAWRFLELQQRFATVAFSALVDHPAALADLQEAAADEGQTLNLLMDLNVGQNRTGILPDERALDLYRQIEAAPNLIPGGLHVYDGHLHQTDLAERTEAARTVYEMAADLRTALMRQGLPVEKMVIGGSPTFAIHAQWPDVELSPGTTVLWDAGYAKKLPDLDFLPAAALLCRVISKPTEDTLCLDLGHKAVASEMPHPRVIFPDLPDAETVMHNEEHLVIRTGAAVDFSPGDALFAIPWHICPTVALHSEVWCVRNGAAAEPWPVVGRARRLSI
jgi:D-serine deaminase-like pyridoxal phosphate-dependent protein